VGACAADPAGKATRDAARAPVRSAPFQKVPYENPVLASVMMHLFRCWRFTVYTQCSRSQLPLSVWFDEQALPKGCSALRKEALAALLCCGVRKQGQRID
jgi:hypothetical protein